MNSPATGKHRARRGGGGQHAERLQVLRGVSAMLTTAEIADELYISTNTVKAHIKNICHKLRAAHRNAAVRRPASFS